MELVSLAAGIAIGITVGVMCYRYLLKRNPEKLERWAAQAKSAGKSAGF